MGFNNIGGGMNITIQLGGAAANPQSSNEGPQSFQPRFDSAKSRLDNNRGDSEALKDLRDLKKDVDSALHKEVSKEYGNMKQQDMLEKLLAMIMQLLQQVIGGDEEGEGEGKGKKEGKTDSKGPHLTITIPLA